MEILEFGREIVHHACAAVISSDSDVTVEIVCQCAVEEVVQEGLRYQKPREIFSFDLAFVHALLIVMALKVDLQNRYNLIGLVMGGVSRLEIQWLGSETTGTMTNRYNVPGRIQFPDTPAIPCITNVRPYIHVFIEAWPQLFSQVSPIAEDHSSVRENVILIDPVREEICIFSTMINFDQRVFFGSWRRR